MASFAARASLLSAALPLAGAVALWWSAPADPSRWLFALQQPSALLQALTAEPRGPVPELWSQRLPPGLVRRLWQQQRGPWWQLWGSHAGAAATLVVPNRPELAQLAHSLPLGPYRLVAANALALQSLQRQLGESQPLNAALDCPALSRGVAAVAWRADALPQMASAWTPLLLPLRHGCLRRSGALWHGHTSAQPRRFAAAAAPVPLPAAKSLVAPVLLQLRGRRLAPLLQELLLSEPLRGALQRQYGLKPELVQQILQRPFQLQLRQNLAASPYKALLLLQLQSTPAQGAQLRQQLERKLGSSPRRTAASQVQSAWQLLPSGELHVSVGGALPQPLQPLQPLGAAAADLDLLARPAQLQRLQLLPPALPGPIAAAAGLRASWRSAQRPGAADQLAAELSLP